MKKKLMFVVAVLVLAAMVCASLFGISLPGNGEVCAFWRHTWEREHLRELGGQEAVEQKLASLASGQGRLWAATRADGAVRVVFEWGKDFVFLTWGTGGNPTIFPIDGGWEEARGYLSEGGYQWVSDAATLASIRSTLGCFKAGAPASIPIVEIPLLVLLATLAAAAIWPRPPQQGAQAFA